MGSRTTRARRRLGSRRDRQGVGDDVHRTARGEEYARSLVGVGKLRRIARGAARAQGVPGFLAALRLANDDDGAGAIDLGEIAKADGRHL